MKKLICIIVLLSCLGMTVYANPNMQGDIGNINVPKSAPMIDGNITSAEGWSEGVYAYKDLMATFGNCNDILQSFYLYYAFDENGLYYAADILDNSFVFSTGEDDIDNKKNDFNIKNENVYGYNGDIFTFTMDPLGRFVEYGYMGNTDYNGWYSVGIFEGNICRMYRGHNRSGDITDQVKLQGHTTDKGWCFEAFIPWNFFIEDAEDMSFAEICPTVEEMAKAGAKHRAMAIYLDRFVDPESGDVATYQRFATCGYELIDGLLGYLSSGMCLKAYGITLSLEGSHTSDAEPDDTDSQKITDSSEKAEDKDSTTKKSDKTTTKKQNTQKPTTAGGQGSGAAQTLDVGIAIGVGVCAIAIIGFIFVKKIL